MNRSHSVLPRISFSPSKKISDGFNMPKLKEYELKT